MEIHLDCLPCFLKQVLDASRMVTDCADLQQKIMEEAIGIVSDYKNFRNSPEVGREMHRLVKKHTGSEDPYRKIKDRNIEEALAIYPRLKAFLSQKDDTLYWALRIAAAGNVIDYAITSDIDLENSISKDLEQEFAICDIGRLRHQLEKAKSILILGDNAGETVFDRVMLEEFLQMEQKISGGRALGNQTGQHPRFDIVYAVRAKPIINDATLEDAQASGLDQCAKLISSGCDAPGVILEECSSEFIDIYNNADIVISKGQGNFETLSDVKRDMYFLLKAKCQVNARKLGVSVNSYIFKWNGVC